MNTIIAWDLGATKCAAGVLQVNSAGELNCIKTFTVKLNEVTSLAELVLCVENGLTIKFADAQAICIGAAGHFDGRVLTHTNPYPYPMAFADLAAAQHWPAFAVIHDYASIVCSTFTSHVEKPIHYKPHGRRVAFGIGTGLGVKDGVLFENGDFWLGHNEMGHIGVCMPPLAKAEHLQRHREIVKFLRDKHATHVTFEEILSGRGLARLHSFFYTHADKLTPEETGGLLARGQASELADAFAWYAGLFTGTLQLSFMPEGGIYITGGVALTHSTIFDLPAFTDGIHASPAYLTQRQAFPITVLNNNHCALYGCGYYAMKRLTNLNPRHIHLKAFSSHL